MKVQYPGLESAVTADLTALASLATGAAILFPNAFDFGWIVKELQVSRLGLLLPRTQAPWSSSTLIGRHDDKHDMLAAIGHIGNSVPQAPSTDAILSCRKLNLRAISTAVTKLLQYAHCTPHGYACSDMKKLGNWGEIL